MQYSQGFTLGLYVEPLWGSSVAIMLFGMVKDPNGVLHLSPGSYPGTTRGVPTPSFHPFIKMLNPFMGHLFIWLYDNPGFSVNTAGPSAPWTYMLNPFGVL